MWSSPELSETLYDCCQFHHSISWLLCFIDFLISVAIDQGKLFNAQLFGISVVVAESDVEGAPASWQSSVVGSPSCQVLIVLQLRTQR